MNKKPLMLKKRKISAAALPDIAAGKRNASFFEDVYSIVRLIPKGRVTSYGAVAAALGTRLSARMVGWAMNSAHAVTPSVPAHRVVNRAGLLSGKMHFNPPEQMQQLLEAEGIVVQDDQVQSFAEVYWDPEKELGLD